MKTSLTMFSLLCSLAVGCTLDPPETTTESAPEEVQQKHNRQGPVATDAVKKGPSAVQTPEIICILEKERIELTATTHSQTIYIRLKDGREYRGTYAHAQAGRYSDDENLFDILNLVTHIKKKRPAEETDGWTIMCE